jgi:hypothetical protein
VENPAGDQEPAAVESSRVAKRAEHASSAEQHGADKHTEGSVPNADTPMPSLAVLWVSC